MCSSNLTSTSRRIHPRPGLRVSLIAIERSKCGKSPISFCLTTVEDVDGKCQCPRYGSREVPTLEEVPSSLEDLNGDWVSPLHMLTVRSCYGVETGGARSC